MSQRTALLGSAFVLAVVSVSGGTPAAAQTIANGPYFALPAWDQTLPAASRFISLANFDNKAILDRETGLVWQVYRRRPIPYYTYGEAYNVCLNEATGGRLGWRLPSITELLTLVDPAPGASAPIGNPLRGVVATFWTSTKAYSPFIPSLYSLTYLDDRPYYEVRINNWTTLFEALCVRGGPGVGNDVP